MKNRSFRLLISILLVITMSFTCAFSVACNGGNDVSSGGSSPKEDVTPEPTPEPEPDPDTAEDRSQYTYANVLTNASDLYVKDLIGMDPDAIASVFKGYLLGDFYSVAIDEFVKQAEGKLPLGIKLNVMGLSVYRGIDGNWYRPIQTNKKDAITGEYITENNRVNGCLNNILNYKLDSNKKLKINYSLYGEKTLAYILLDYTPSTDSSYDRSWMIGMAIKTSPELEGAMNMTLNELRTLMSDTSTDAEKEAIIIKRFGDVEIGSHLPTIISVLEKQLESGEQNATVQTMLAILKQAETNEFVIKTTKITVKQYLAIKNAQTDAERYNTLATVYKGVTIGQVLGLDDTMKGYISEIHDTSLNGIFTAMANGNLKSYVYGRIRGLTIDKIIESYLREDADALANYKKIYNQYKLFFDLSVKDFVDAYDALKDSTMLFKDKVLQAMYDTVKDIPVVGDMTVDGVVQGIKAGVVPKTDTAPASFDFLASLKYFDEHFADDLATVSITETVNMSQLLKGVISSFVADGEGNYKFDLDTLTGYLETAFEGKLDEASQTVAGMSYADLKAMLKKWSTPKEDGSVDYDMIAGDVFKIFYNKVLAPNGMTEEAFIARLNKMFGKVVTSDNCTTIVTQAVNKLTGLSGQELDDAFLPIAGKTFTDALEEITADVTAGKTPVTAVYNFVKAYGKDVLTLACKDKEGTLPDEDAILNKLKTIIDNNTSVDENGNKKVNYTGVVCDLYSEYRTTLVSFVKNVNASEIDGNKLGELTFDYDIVEFLCFKGLDDNLDGLKAGTATWADVENDYLKNMRKFMGDYIEKMSDTVDDKVLYSFTDSKGNVLDVTAKEVYAIIGEVLKYKGGDSTADVVGAVQNLFGDAKVSTVIEFIDYLNEKYGETTSLVFEGMAA